MEFSICQCEDCQTLLNLHTSPPCPSPPLVLPPGRGGGVSLGHPKFFRCGSLCCWDTIWGTSCILQGTFPKGNGFPKICLRLPSLLLRRQNHHPRVLPKAFRWKVVSMCESSRSSGAGPRNFTPSFMLQLLCLQMCVYGGSAVPQGGWGTVTWQPSPRGGGPSSLGMSGFHFRGEGGGGGAVEPPKTGGGGVREKGSIDRHH